MNLLVVGLLPADDGLLKLQFFIGVCSWAEKGKGNIQQVVFKKEKDTFLIYILEECESLLLHLLMVVFDLFPAVQLHTEPEYKDETMTVYQVPLTGEHEVLQRGRGSTCSVSTMKAQGAASVCQPE